jgi:hypothetical protein
MLELIKGQACWSLSKDEAYHQMNRLSRHGKHVEAYQMNRLSRHGKHVEAYQMNRLSRHGTHVEAYQTDKQTWQAC